MKIQTLPKDKYSPRCKVYDTGGPFRLFVYASKEKFQTPFISIKGMTSNAHTSRYSANRILREMRNKERTGA